MQYIILALWTCSNDYNHVATLQLQSGGGSSSSSSRSFNNNTEEEDEDEKKEMDSSKITGTVFNTTMTLSSNHLRAVCDFIKDSSEFICYCACQTVSHLARNEDIAIQLFQHGALFPWKTLLDNVAYGPIVQGKMSKSEAKCLNKGAWK